MTAHEEWKEACGKVDKHLETCVECDDFRSPPCKEADGLLDIVAETCDRRSQAIKDNAPKP